MLMGRERKAQRERRIVHFRLREGLLLNRKPPTDAEVQSFLRGVDTRDFHDFGVKSLAAVNLNVLHALPAAHTQRMTRNAGFEERLTLLSYAAWRRRYQAIKQLLVAAASPTTSQRAPLGALGAASNDEAELCALLSRRHGHGVDSATACHIVECVGRMRTVAARDASLGATHPPCGMCGADGLSVLFDPCGCVVLSQRDDKTRVRVKDALALRDDVLEVDDCGYTMDGELLYGSPDGEPYRLARVGDDLRWTLGDGASV